MHKTNEIEPKSPKLIVSLNDDCLYCIFQFLDDRDIFSTLQVCERFHKLIRDRFAKRFEEICLEKYIQEDNVECDHNVDNCLVKNALINIGDLIQNLVIPVPLLKAPEAIWNTFTLIEEYCQPDKLHILGWVGKDMDGFRQLNSYRKLFENIAELGLQYCYINEDDNAEDRFLACPNVKVLRLSFVQNSISDLNLSTPALESCFIENNWTLDFFGLCTFLKRNIQLKKLAVIFNEYFCSRLFMSDIENFENLECLSVFFLSFGETQYLRPILSLKQLREFNVSCRSNEINSFLMALATKGTINNLGIISRSFDKNICQILNEWKNLHILKLTSIFSSSSNLLQHLNLPNLIELHLIHFSKVTFNDVSDIVRTMVNLQKLLIHKCTDIEKISSVNFVRLVEIVQSRVNGVRLVIMMDEKIYKEFVSDETINRYQHLLKITRDKEWNEYIHIVSDLVKNPGIDSGEEDYDYDPDYDIDDEEYYHNMDIGESPGESGDDENIANFENSDEDGENIFGNVNDSNSD